MALTYGIDTSKGETPESVRRKRDMIRSLLGAQRAPQNVGEGLSALGDGIVAAILDGRADKAESAGLASASSVFGTLTGGGDFPAAPATDASVVSSAPSRDTSRTGSTIDFANAGSPADLQPHQRALLDTIAGPESAGKYDVIYGGGRFSDFSDHPRKAVPIGSGPNAGRTSSAAGKYQFLGSTWDDQAKKLGLTDFSPASQDKAAWNLASESYRNATGGDLDAVLRSGDTNAIAGVGKALAPIWTSLPGGIEQGTNTSRFLKAYNGYLGQGGPSAALETMAAQDPVRVASLDPAAGVFEAGAEQGLSPDNPGLQALARIAASEGTEAAPKVPGVQIAQALSGTPEMAGNAPSGRRQPSIPELLGGLGNEWMSPAQQKILGVMLEQRLKQQDPDYGLGLEKDRLAIEKQRLEIDAARNPKPKTTDDIDEFNFGQTNPAFVEYMERLKKAGATNVDARQMGTIPPGYRAEYDANGQVVQLVPIPGGPAAADAQAADDKTAKRVDQAQVTSDTVINAARLAREALGQGMLPTTGTLGNLAAVAPETSAAEVRRQVDTLKSIAAAENINAMRQASPTGAALGNASDADIALLKNKAGALDPGAGEDRFRAALDDYERTLLRIVHGQKDGDAMFEASRPADAAAAKGKLIRDMTDEELEAIINGR